VRDRKAKKNASGVYLPFEEDSQLTVILAKAFTAVDLFVTSSRR
jgi:hypothetical protein